MTWYGDAEVSCVNCRYRFDVPDWVEDDIQLCAYCQEQLGFYEKPWWHPRPPSQEYLDSINNVWEGPIPSAEDVVRGIRELRGLHAKCKIGGNGAEWLRRQ